MFFTEVLSLHTSEISHGGEAIFPVLSAGNVFQTIPIFTDIRGCTRGRSRISVLSVGNLFQ
ncbi:unnamed protein product [Staurois parvus]|uniref:Uncharacterized protein n=1 Tax=Staurois parvus TaxID=386267 RepID=A0ABN9A647_9NEOB|nr:unnamed protein product [Staurois parvus]